ncbi:phage holin family protein [Defluviimonas aestuarii]|uniref:phage holin family protein n=1 Tax=Albidovulum aestuarii TaxID=1130726 RepID=UPI00249BFA26|nr:phage holin family protein [Defluviimonas aestuarii]MDI3335557.1 phage holin family protein [Defluviimonas aestuarii]
MDANVRSTRGLLSDAFHGITQLMRGELALARAEAEENIRSIATGASLVLLAATVFFVGLNVLADAAVAALANQGFATGWAALIVAASLIVIAAVLAAIGRHAFSSTKIIPRRTVMNIRRDADTFKEAMSHDTSL